MKNKRAVKKQKKNRHLLVKLSNTRLALASCYIAYLITRSKTKKKDQKDFIFCCCQILT